MWWVWMLVGLSPFVGFVLWALTRTEVWKSDDFGDLAVRKVLNEGHGYEPVKALLEPTDAGPWDVRYLRVLGISRSLAERRLAGWVLGEPKSSSARLAHGARLLQLAWEARGYGRGHEVTPERGRRFHELLERARAALMAAATLNPADPTPWALLITVATYANDDEALRRSYFVEATSRDAHNWPAHQRRLVSLTRKWSGSHEAMYAFARDVTRRAPEGSDLPIVLLKAHLEYEKYVRGFAGEVAEADRFMDDEVMRAECVAAYQKSLGHAAHEERATSVFARINASAWLWRLRDQARLRTELQALGERLHRKHWRWTCTEDQLDDARKFAGLTD